MPISAGGNTGSSETRGAAPRAAQRRRACSPACCLPAQPTRYGRRPQAPSSTAVDDEMRAVLSPQLPLVAQALPADTASEAIRLAELLGFPADEVVIEIANAVTRHAASSGQRTGCTAARVAADGFPDPARCEDLSRSASRTTARLRHLALSGTRPAVMTVSADGVTSPPTPGSRPASRSCRGELTSHVPVLLAPPGRCALPGNCGHSPRDSAA